MLESCMIKATGLGVVIALVGCTFQARDPNGGSEPEQGGGEQAGGGEQNGGGGGGGTQVALNEGGGGAQAGSNCGQSNFGQTNLAPGFMPDPATAAGRSGGNVNANEFGQSQTGPCAGWIAQSPDHTMYLAQPFQFMKVLVQSNDDTTLVIQGPDGSWCSDDEGGGTNPMVQGGWVAGCYRIWVGSFQQGTESPYQVTFTERR